MIQSSSNPNIQHVKKLLKSRKQSEFVIEGRKLLQEAIGAGMDLNRIFATPEFWTREREWLEPLERQRTEITLITPALLKSISTLESPEGVVAVAPKPGLSEDTAVMRFAIFLISIRDPGNFGAIIRTAEACGAEWVGYSTDCVDPFQPKVIRSSMGSLFRMRLVEIAKPREFAEHLMQKGIAVYGLAGSGEKRLQEWKPVYPSIACVGSESHGLPEDFPLTDKISIPMKGKVESLNAAVAAAVFLYALADFSNSSPAHDPKDE